MGADQHIDWTAAAASTLDWWREAGVDVLVEDAPAGWLTEPPAPAPAPPRAPAATVAPAAPLSLPDTLAAFLDWRMGPEAPEGAWHGTALPAAGPADAALMVLVDCPQREDGEALLSGAAGRLFERMLAAIGTTRAAVHLAAVSTKRPITGRMPRDLEARLGEIARHHIDLVAPRRLILMGDAASRAVLSMNVAEARQSLRALNHRNGNEGQAIATFHPRTLLERPVMKAEAWRDLQMLMRVGA